MSRTTKYGVTSFTHAHDGRDNTAAFAFGSISYTQPMVGVRKRIAEIDTREQLAELLDDGTTWAKTLSGECAVWDQEVVWRKVASERVSAECKANPWADEDDNWDMRTRMRTYTSESNGYPFQGPVRLEEWELSLLLKPAPVIEHVVPKEVRLNTLAKTLTTTVLEECEKVYGAHHATTDAVRTQQRAERAAALKRENVLRFGFIPALVK